MSITFENLNGGVGMRALYGVLRGGEHVATMSRSSSRQGWIIYSVHYSHKLAGAKDIEQARQKACTLVYPTQQEVYEHLCAQSVFSRRNYIERQSAPQLARLARDLVAGSNSARLEIEKLVASWDLFALDRSDTHAAAIARVEEKNKEVDPFSSEWTFAESPGVYPYYPKPPI
jgi:hypothetical protein